MTSPVQAVTTDDGRYYTWPRYPKRHFPSITTVIKQGVPKPTMEKWALKLVALTAIDRAEQIVALKRKANQYIVDKEAKASK